MGPVRLPVDRPIDIRGVRYKSFQLIKGDRAEISITLDPAVLAHMGKPMETREKGDIVWTRILTLTTAESYASHTGLAAAVLVEGATSGSGTTDDPVVTLMGQS